MTTKATTARSMTTRAFSGISSLATLVAITVIISTSATPVSKPDTVNRHGSSSVFHSGTPGTEYSSMPV